MEDHIFHGKHMKNPDNGREILDIAPVVPGEAQEKANFHGILGGGGGGGLFH